LGSPGLLSQLGAGPDGVLGDGSHQEQTDELGRAGALAVGHGSDSGDEVGGEPDGELLFAALSVALAGQGGAGAPASFLGRLFVDMRKLGVTIPCR
jgi:hypothetical protein